MINTRIKLSALWVSLMLSFLLGDVLRIYSGDFVGGQVGGGQIPKEMYLGIAIVLVMPVVMLFLSLVLKHAVNRWTNIAVAIFFFLFNLVGLPGYASAFDQFLIVVGLVFNLLTIGYAWKWKKDDV